MSSTSIASGSPAGSAPIRWSARRSGSSPRWLRCTASASSAPLSPSSISATSCPFHRSRAAADGAGRAAPAGGRRRMSAPLPYMPAIGKTVVRKIAVAGRRPLLDLSLNESSHGASPLAVAAATERCQRLMRYPDPASTALRQAIGRCYDLPPGDLVCGNGSEELLDIIGRLFARPADEILFSDHGFLQFAIVAQRVGATPVRAAERRLTADIGALLAAVTPRTRVLFLANPNNPTGTHVGAADLRRL